MEQELQPQPTQMESNDNKRFIIAILVTMFVVGFGTYFLMSKSINQNQAENGQAVETEEMNDNNDYTSENIEDRVVYLHEENEELILLEASNLRKVGCCYYLDDEAQEIYYLKKDIDGHSTQRDTRSYNLGHASTIDFYNFSIFENDSRYAHDLTNVYAVLSIPWSLDYEFGVVKEADPLTFEPKIVEQFDVSRGNSYQGWLSRDKNNVYYKHGIFEHADPESFEISRNVSINKDKNNVYLWRKILPEADPQTYEILLDRSGGRPGTVYGKDKDNFFVDYCALDGVDLASLSFEETFDEGPIFSDKDGVFTIEHNEELNTCSVVRE